MPWVKTYICDKCGSERVARVIYGTVDNTDPRLHQELQAGRLLLGGCCHDRDYPDYVCRDCGFSFHLRRDGRAEPPKVSWAEHQRMWLMGALALEDDHEGQPGASKA